MTRETIDRVIDWLAKTDIPTVDLTGGAPEMIPDFKYLVERLKALTPPRHIIDRCNLTILLEPGFEDYAPFLARHQVEIIASMPCYSPENVNAQRGEGVFDGSIEGLAAFEFVRLRDRSRAPAPSRLQSERCLPPGSASGVGSRIQTRVERPFRNRLQPALHHYEPADRAFRFLVKKQWPARRLHGAPEQTHSIRRP